MHKQIKIGIAGCFYYSGLVGLARRWTQREQHLIILNYHRASGGDLRRHLLYLQRHYRVLPFEEALKESYTPDREKMQEHDRRTPLVVTFDDGYYDNYTHAYALACELRIPLTFFLIPGYVESGDYFWWEEGKRLVSRAQVDKIVLQGHTYHLEQREEREILAQTIDTRLRYSRSVAEREAFLLAARKALAVSPSIAEEERAALPLTWTIVQEMEESGWISFGAHTMHHPILAYLESASEVQSEVDESRAVMEKQLGHPVRLFAYPVGKAEHIGDRGLQAVKEAGYEWAVTTIHGMNTWESDPYLLRRITVDVSRHWRVMACETSCVWHFFSSLWKRFK